MSEQLPARKRHRSEDSSEDELSKKTKLHASGSGLQCDNQLQLRIDEGIRQLSARRSDLQRGCVASKERILALLDAMRAEILGGAASDKHSLRRILPDEVLLDIFEYLDRIRLERLQHVCRTFRTIIDGGMTDVCFRVINTVHIHRVYECEYSITAWTGSYDDTSLLTSDVSEQGERKTIIGHKLTRAWAIFALANVCRNANVTLYKISGANLSEAVVYLDEKWPMFVPATAKFMTISEFVLVGCNVAVPPDCRISPETILTRMLERFRRVREVRLSVRLREGVREAGFTDLFLEFCAARGINSVGLFKPHNDAHTNNDKPICENGVIKFLLDAPGDDCKRKLQFSGVRGVTARFYDALVKASTECTTAHTASLNVDCDVGSLPQQHVRNADEETAKDWGYGGGEKEYRFFRGRGLQPFSITGRHLGSSSSFSYKRGGALRRNEDEGGDDEPEQDDHVDDNEEEEHDGNDVE